MSFIAKKIFDTFAVRYRASLAKKLNAYGLVYDDLLIENEDVVKALARADPTAIAGRDMRIKRAYDMSAKKKTAKMSLNTFDFYLTPLVEKAKNERQERAILNSH